MCETCDIQTLSRLQVNQYDPTRTTTLRAAFVSNFRRRFTTLIRLVQESIVVNDCFGLTNDININALNPAGRNQFSFPTNIQKAEAFMKWFNAQVDAAIFELGTLQQVGTSIDNAWYNKYVFDSYKRGVQRARTEMGKLKISIPPDSLEIGMGVPIHVETLGILYSRVFSTLKGITAAMDTQISIILTQGLADGDNPVRLARKLVSTINGAGMGDLGITDSIGRFVPAQRRAETLARTETIRAHHRATINEYMNWRVVDVYVMAEFMTAGDDRVCPDCLSLEGGKYTLEAAMNLIPVHANCRCICLPYEIKR